MGKPVVARGRIPIAESVADGETGFLTEPNNEREVTRGMIELMRDPQRAPANWARPAARRSCSAGRWNGWSKAIRI